MIKKTSCDYTEIFPEANSGEFNKIDITLPLQKLFDDAITFISKTDFEN